MGTNARKMLTGGALGALTLGMFGLGMHLAPDAHAGRNLAQPNQVGQVGSAATGNPLVLAASHTHIADGDPSSNSDGTATSQDQSIMDGPATTFQQVYLLLQRDYVDGVPSDKTMGHGAATAMLNSLQDPNSRFLEQPEMQEMQNESKGLYHGAGLVTAVRKLTHPANKTANTPEYIESRLTIVSALPGSPAEKAGLKSGDVITDIDGHWLATYDPIIAQAKELKAVQDDPVAFNKIATVLQKKVDNAYSLTVAESKLDDPSVKSLALTISRPGSPAPIAVTLDTTASDQITAIVSRTLPGNIGYIKINQFTQGADTDFSKAFDGFGTDVKGLVLDLRNCPGGILGVGTAIAARLTNAPALGYLETRGKKITPISVTTGTGVSYPVTVLVDGGTANAAELLAATLQAHGSKLVGEQTFGDASAVKTIALKDGSGFTMTIGHLFTQDHKDFGDTGIKPDVEVPATSDTDEPLNRAIGVVSGRMAGNPSNRG